MLLVIKELVNAVLSRCFLSAFGSIVADSECISVTENSLWPQQEQPHFRRKGLPSDEARFRKWSRLNRVTNESVSILLFL